jgi:YVTN family beta-propeller protein
VHRLGLVGRAERKYNKVKIGGLENAGIRGEECYMYNNNSNRSCAAWARGFTILFAMLALGLGLMASRAEAQPFAYVANQGDNTVSVIATASNTVVATIPVGSGPVAVAVTPDGDTRLCRE